MAGKKKKKGPISKGVRVNTVTKEVKIETSPSHSSISSSSRVVESLEDEIMQVGYLKLFQRNPNYNIIFIDSKTKQKLTLKHESLMRIFNLNKKILSQIPPYIIIQIISGEKNVEEFQSLEDIKKNQAFTNLFNFLTLYSCVCKNNVTVDISKFSIGKILKFLHKDIFGIANYLTINIIKVSYTELTNRRLRNSGLLVRAHSKELSDEILENEMLTNYTLKPQVDFSTKNKKIDMLNLSNSLHLASTIQEEIREKIRNKRKEIQDHLNNPLSKYLQTNDSFVQQASIEKIVPVKGKSKKDFSVKNINGEIIKIKNNEIKNLKNANKTFVKVKDNKTNDEILVSADELGEIYSNWKTFGKEYKIKNQFTKSEIRFIPKDLSPCPVEEVIDSKNEEDEERVKNEKELDEIRKKILGLLTADSLLLLIEPKFVIASNSLKLIVSNKEPEDLFYTSNFYTSKEEKISKEKCKGIQFDKEKEYAEIVVKGGKHLVKKKDFIDTINNLKPGELVSIKDIDGKELKMNIAEIEINPYMKGTVRKVEEMKKPTLKKIETKNTNTENSNKQSQENEIINIEQNEQPIKNRQEMRGGRKEFKNNKKVYKIQRAIYKLIKI